MLGAVILVAAIALIVALVARDDSPARATVPAVTGLPVAEATNVLRTDHLRVDTVTSPNATVAAGLVAAQTPPAATRVDRGRTVVLTVSSGAPAAPTPVPIPVPVPQSVASTTTTTHHHHHDDHCAAEHAAEHVAGWRPAGPERSRDRAGIEEVPVSTATIAIFVIAIVIVAAIR